ncbi:MAG: hypothetical protein CMD52_03045 [Gammaproteobacteria bacterium]|nr:hypothetical protein [Gammaproteobacteria bacterium]|tara:strand:+ start:1179 stop:2201 length:1023 start_codon:yes stop_codon:yes gene_type:complete
MLNETGNKFSTLYGLLKHLPENVNAHANLLKAVAYNVKPRRTKSSMVSHLPVSITVYINTICNYRCKFCFLITDTHIGSKQMNITDDQFLKIIDHPQNRYASRITLGGGEPFLHKKLFDYVKLLKEKNKIVSIYSNGSLIDRRLDELEQTPFDYLNISHYDEHFEKITNGLNKLLEIKHRPVLRLSKIISTENLDDMRLILDLASSLKIDSVIFQNYFPSKKEDESKVIYANHRDYTKLKKELSKNYANLEILWPNVLKHEAKFNCQNIALNATYDSNGNQAPCCFIVPPDPNNGNLFEESNPWNSKQMRDFRACYTDEISEHKSCKSCYFRSGIQNRYR